MTSAVMELKEAIGVNLQRACRKYLRERNVSMSFAGRVNKHMLAQVPSGILGKMAQERNLLKALPLTLQIELSEMVRGPVILNSPLLVKISQTNSLMVRWLCHLAITPEVTLAREACFGNREICKAMRWVDSGEFWYMQDHVVSSVYPDTEGTPAPSEMPLKVKRLESLSEAVLWTKWEHCGVLLAETDGVTLDLNAETFGQLVVNHERVWAFAVKYAKRFLLVSDRLPAFELGAEAFAAQWCDHERHLVFISHFKMESGTEAALVQQEMSNLIHDDPTNPGCDLSAAVFLDSEDLKDLRQIKAEVKRSENLLILLTPGLLYRPWCLLEIVIAVENEVNLLPVVIERPGVTFQFPTQEFYDGLHDGRSISPEAMELIQREGNTPDQLERAIRQVFLQIALPFSPHKSARIRQAELKDILKHCVYS
eukprot:CAMPEP_0170652904 /NCGR_PEP_ID=MMETSP0224-20130122/47136_1 /TAXON_ID=285029 /ORGANISM="Togula jolla, Strain CCCM 725" /LENGTH=424 /DNA_ID=CAMNT_0010984767 /DNA_START=342 /DNA_END=1616 /DNA_ORIENTATION=+